jgi:hypothetical protein
MECNSSVSKYLLSLSLALALVFISLREFFVFSTFSSCTASLLAINTDFISAADQINPATFNGSKSIVKVLFAFVALGKESNSQRSQIVKNNMDFLLEQRSKSLKYEIDCLIFAYADYSELPGWAQEMIMHRNQSLCKIVKIFGFRFTHFLKVLEPGLISAAGYKYLIIQADDVVLYPPEANFRFVDFMDIVVNYNLSIASPGIIGTVHKHLTPNPSADHIGRFVTGIEIQSTTFSMEAWNCWWEMQDTQFPSGWGADVWFWDYCVTQKRVKNSKIAIIDEFTCKHKRLKSTNVGPGKQSSPMQEFSDQVKFWRDIRKQELKSLRFKSLGQF